MKTTLLLTLAAMVFLIACDVEQNAPAKVLDYSATLILLPFAILNVYALLHTDELKKWLNESGN